MEDRSLRLIVDAFSRIIFAIGTFTIIASGIVWYIIKLTIGIRVTAEEELEGVDLAEIGMEAYPDFKK